MNVFYIDHETAEVRLGLKPKKRISRTHLWSMIAFCIAVVIVHECTAAYRIYQVEQEMKLLQGRYEAALMPRQCERGK